MAVKKNNAYFCKCIKGWQATSPKKAYNLYSMDTNKEHNMSRRTAIKIGLMGLAGTMLGSNTLFGADIKRRGKYKKDATESSHEIESKNHNNMKVLLINGSPRRKGNTFLALSEAAKVLEQNGLETEIVQIGTKPVRGCIACGQCGQRKLGRCVFDDDICNSIVDKLDDTDALIVGSPVYYGQPNGTVLSLIQRMFYSAGAKVQNKPAAAVCVCRRGGATAAYQTLNLPFEMMNMPVVTSQYWNIVYGAAEGQAALDTEGMQTMRQMANNMAWLLKKIHANGNPDYPQREPWQPMNFIR